MSVDIELDATPMQRLPVPLKALAMPQELNSLLPLTIQVATS